MSLYKHLLFAALLNMSITYACDDVDYFDNDCVEVFTFETSQSQREEDSYQEINLPQEIESSYREFQRERNEENLDSLVGELGCLQEQEEFTKSVEKIAGKLFSDNKELFKTYCKYNKAKQKIYIEAIEELVKYNLINKGGKIPQLKPDDQGRYTVNKDNDQYFEILKNFIVQYTRGIESTKDVEQDYELYKLMIPNNNDNLHDYIQNQMSSYCFYLLLKFKQSGLTQPIIDGFYTAFYNYWNALINHKLSGTQIDVEIVKEYFKNTFLFLSDVSKDNKKTAIKYIAGIDFGKGIRHNSFFRLEGSVQGFLCYNAGLVKDETWRKLAEEYVSNKYTFGNNLGAASILCGIDQRNFWVCQVLRNLADANKSKADPRFIPMDKGIEYKCVEGDYSCNIKGNEIISGTAVIELDGGEKIYVNVGDMPFYSNNPFQYISKRKRSNGKNIDLRNLHIRTKQVFVNGTLITTIDKDMKEFLLERNIEFNCSSPFVASNDQPTHIVKNGWVFIDNTYYDIDSFCTSRLKLFNEPGEEVYNKLKDILTIKNPSSGKYEVYIKPKKACKINGLNFSKRNGATQIYVSVDDVKKCLQAVVPEEEIVESQYFGLVLDVWEIYWKKLPEAVRKEEVENNDRYSILCSQFNGEGVLRKENLISGEDFLYGWLA